MKLRFARVTRTTLLHPTNTRSTIALGQAPKVHLLTSAIQANMVGLGGGLLFTGTVKLKPIGKSWEPRRVLTATQEHRNVALTHVTGRDDYIVNAHQHEAAGLDDSDTDEDLAVSW